MAVAPVGIADEIPLLSGSGICNCPVCTGVGLSQIPAEIAPTSLPAEIAPLSSLTALSSRPEAKAKLVLDFDGHYLASWGGWTGALTPAFDQDGDVATFSEGELSSIREIWARVAEDYAPLNLDVTTVDPGNQPGIKVARIAIGGHWSGWYGQSASGVAYVGGFAAGGAINVGYVFEDALGGNPKLVAEAAAHEAGHLFGLQHQARWNGSTLVESYHTGDGSWAPLMGIGYNAARTTWHQGPTLWGPRYPQDDLAILAGSGNGFGYRPDDHAGTLATAQPLAFSGTTATVGGIIGHLGDQDVWSFASSGGNVSFDLAVAPVGANLDAVLELWNGAGQLIATAAPSDSLGAKIGSSVGAGTYYLIARGTGDYGNLGQYTITGSVAAGITVAQVQQTVAGTTVSIGWATNLPADSQVEYGTSTSYGSASPLNATSATNHSVSLLNLAAGTTYHYRVKSRDAAGNLAVSGDYTLTTAGATSGAKIIDNRDAEFSTTGNWITYANQGLDDNIHYAAAGSGAAAQWSTPVTPGRYEIAVTWFPFYNRATDAPFTVLSEGTRLGSVLVNQKLPPADLTERGVGWKTLGTFDVRGSNLTVQLANEANEYVIADGVRLLRVGDLPADPTDPVGPTDPTNPTDPVSPTGPTQVEVIDNRDVRFKTVGDWFPYGAQGFDGNIQYAATGSGAKARWTATVAPGEYRVSATWYPDANRATDAPFTVLDGNAPLGAMRVNQELSPAEADAQGIRWQPLGTYRIAGNQLVVELSNDANEYVIADAIRLERIGNLPAANVLTASTANGDNEAAADTGLSPRERMVPLRRSQIRQTAHERPTRRQRATRLFEQQGLAQADGMADYLARVAHDRAEKIADERYASAVDRIFEDWLA